MSGILQTKIIIWSQLPASTTYTLDKSLYLSINLWIQPLIYTKYKTLFDLNTSSWSESSIKYMRGLISLGQLSAGDTAVIISFRAAPGGTVAVEARDGALSRDQSFENVKAMKASKH